MEVLFPEGQASTWPLRESDGSHLYSTHFITMRLSMFAQRKDQINRSNRSNRLNQISLFNRLNQISLFNQLPQWLRIQLIHSLQEPSQVDQVSPNDFYSSGSSREEHKDMVGSRNPSVARPLKGNAQPTVQQETKMPAKSQSEHLPNTASLEASLASCSPISLRRTFLTGKKKEE